MADENQPPTTDEQVDDKNFPDPENFPSYDEVESEVGQSFLPPDGFDESAAKFDEEEGGCC